MSLKLRLTKTKMPVMILQNVNSGAWVNWYPALSSTDALVILFSNKKYPIDWRFGMLPAQQLKANARQQSNSIRRVQLERV